jgi:hypothetical protein
MNIGWPDNLFKSTYCSTPHPSGDAWCRRQPGHPGDHSAFIHKISEPETWKK